MIHLRNLLAAIFIGLLLFSACNQSGGSKAEEVKDESTTASSQITTAYPSYPKDDFLLLLQKCDYIDVIFNEVDVSMNQQHDSDIKGMLSFIQQGDIELPTCTESAYINFQSNGEILAEGNLYLRGKCSHIVWLVDGKPKFGNAFNQSGTNFFRKVLSAGKSTIYE
jgi:hypothetical protein